MKTKPGLALLMMYLISVATACVYVPMWQEYSRGRLCCLSYAFIWEAPGGGVDLASVDFGRVGLTLAALTALFGIGAVLVWARAGTRTRRIHDERQETDEERLELRAVLREQIETGASLADAADLIIDHVERRDRRRRQAASGSRTRIAVLALLLGGAGGVGIGLSLVADLDVLDLPKPAAERITAAGPDAVDAPPAPAPPPRAPVASPPPTATTTPVMPVSPPSPPPTRAGAGPTKQPAGRPKSALELYDEIELSPARAPAIPPARRFVLEPDDLPTPQPHVRPANGQEIIRRDHGGGLGKLRVRNGTPSDAAVKLQDVTSKRALRLVYARSQSDIVLEAIAPGTYILQFAVGRDWEPAAHRFARDRGYTAFAEPFMFHETRESDGLRYATFEVTLHRVRSGNATTFGIDEKEFQAGLLDAHEKRPGSARQK